MALKGSDKSPEILELEMTALTVLAADPTVATYELFRTAFGNHLRSVHHFEEGSIERALLDLDRGEIELPRSLPFEMPLPAPPLRSRDPA